jgi:hypothetical protein
MDVWGREIITGQLARLNYCVVKCFRQKLRSVLLHNTGEGAVSTGTSTYPSSSITSSMYVLPLQQVPFFLFLVLPIASLLSFSFGDSDNEFEKRNSDDRPGFQR